jgi:hypothetical protein
MSNLSSFLNPVSVNDEKEVVISKRFIQRDEKGNPILDKNGEAIPQPFKVRAISQQENDALIRKCTRTVKDRTGKTRELDNGAYQKAIVVAGTVVPDFSDQALCDHYGTMLPDDVPGKMLYAGEFNKLFMAITELSGITDTDDVEEEAKN